MKNTSRRDFLVRHSLAGLGAFTLGPLAAGTPHKTQMLTENAGNGVIKSLAGLSLAELSKRYRNELFNRFLPAMENLSIDHELGGFMCDIDISSRKPITTNKKTWFQGRGIWVYSFLYNNFEKNPHYLSVAKKAIDFILKLKPGDDNFWDDHYTKAGKRNSRPGDIYGNLFVAEGLAEYARATGEKHYLEQAKEIIFYCVNRYDQPDYTYHADRIPGIPPIPAPRVLGHWMILLSLSTQILQQGPDAGIEKLANRCIESILKYHLNPEFKILNEIINHDLTIPGNEYAQFAVIGHGMETLAFVMAEAVRRRDAALFKQSSEIFRRHVEVAADKLYGGYFEELYDADQYVWSMTKSTWSQQEILVGTMLMIEHLGDEWAQECYSELEAYVQEKMVRPDFAFWTFGGDRKLINPSVSIVEHYHTPRYLMRNILALDRIIKRRGRISGWVG